MRPLAASPMKAQSAAGPNNSYLIKATPRTTAISRLTEYLDVLRVQIELFKLLHCGEPNKIRYAALLLNELETTDTIKAEAAKQIVKQLNDPNTVFEAAEFLLYLGRHKEEAIEALAALLFEDNPLPLSDDGKIDAISLLGRLGAVRYAGRIAELLAHDSLWAVAATALGEMRAKEHSAALIRRLSTADSRSKLIYFRALILMGESPARTTADLLAIINDPECSNTHTRMAAEQLDMLKRRAELCGALRDRLRGKKGFPYAELENVGRLKFNELADDVAALLDREDARHNPLIIDNIIGTLAELKAEKHAGIITGFLDHEDSFLVSSAVSSLGYLKRKEYSARILSLLLQRDRMRSVRYISAIPLALHAMRAEAELTAAANYSMTFFNSEFNLGVELEAAKVLGLIGVERAKAAATIAYCLGSRNPDVRNQAIYYLGRIQAKNYALDLLGLLRDDRAVEPLVVEALARIFSVDWSAEKESAVHRLLWFSSWL